MVFCEKNYLLERWVGRCSYLLIMKRETIILRTPGSEAEVPKPKLLDSRGKRPSNNKISIYSQKYTTIMSTHSLPEENTQLPTPLIKIYSDVASIQHSKELKGHDRTMTTNCETSSRHYFDEKLLLAIRQQINAARVRYEAKMNQMLEASAKTICELRQVLVEQQKKIAEKQVVIYRLMMEKQTQFRTGTPPQSAFVSVQNNSPQKLKHSEFIYLNDKIEDMSSKLAILVDSMEASDRQTSLSLQKMQNNLIRNNGSKIAQCRNNLMNCIVELNRKIEIIDKRADIVPRPKYDQTSILRIQSLKCEINQFRKQMQNFYTKEWSYDSAALVKLQLIMSNLNEKIKTSSLKGSRYDGHFLEDDDQFFYPSIGESYVGNDDYQHFQQDSEQQFQKKQNRHPNCRSEFLKEHH